MKNRILIIAAAVLCILAVSCSPNSTEVIKGNLERVEFSAPGTFTLSGDTYALINHEYNRGEYKVYAYYSTGYKEDVTNSATITAVDSSLVSVSSSGVLKFTNDECPWEHEFGVTVSYGGKTTSAVAYAYRPYEAIGGLRVNYSKFIEGSVVSANIAGISCLTESGAYYSSSSLPGSASATIAIYNETSDEVKTGKVGSLKFEAGDVLLVYAASDDSDASYFSIEVLGKSAVSKLRPGYFRCPDPGDTYDKDKFVATYMKNYRVQLSNSDGTIRSIVYVTDEDGKINDESFTITPTVTRDSSAVTDDEFKKGDVVEVTITYKKTDSDTVIGKVKYTV